jgi:hypothetical protein
MREQAKALSGLAREFQAIVWEMQYERESGASGGTRLLDLHKAVVAKRETVREAVAGIIELANAELEMARG